MLFAKQKSGLYLPNRNLFMVPGIMASTTAPQASSYSNAFIINLRDFGSQVTGNVNQGTTTYSTTGLKFSDLIDISGAATGISCTVSDAADNNDTTSLATNTATDTFPVTGNSYYLRGARLGFTGTASGVKTFRFTFAGFTADASIRATSGFGVSNSYATSNLGNYSVNSGTKTAVDCSTPVEYIIEDAANGSGTLTVEYFVNDNAADINANGIGVCALRIDF